MCDEVVESRYGLCANDAPAMIHSNTRQHGESMVAAQNKATSGDAHYSGDVTFH